MKKVTQIITIIFLMLNSSILFAENPDFLEVNGKVTSGSKIMKNAVITITSQDKSMQMVSTDNDGYFNVSLNHGMEYTFNVIQDGHSSKTIIFSTKAPDQFKLKSYKFYCMVDLNKTKRKVQAQETELNTVGYVFFNRKGEFFTHKSKTYEKKQHYGYFYK